MGNSVVRGNYSTNSDIIATFKEYFQRDLGPELKNLSYFNSTAK